MRYELVLVSVVIASLSGCATSLPEREVDNSFAVGGTRWEGGGGVYASFKVFEETGNVGLCGVYSAYNDSYLAHNLNDQALASMYVEIGDKIIANNIGFFNRVTFYEDKAPVGRAACKRTSVAWRPEFASLEPQVSSGKSRFKVLD